MDGLLKKIIDIAFCDGHLDGYNSCYTGIRGRNVVAIFVECL